ncbi:dTDP-4-dehydrorhamnose reductase [Lactiplantibacillus plantarum]|uniref:dTDP-4-dehydrorhamnose reductase n=1 Tax=Lactiplantibacillus plantarum TaxID=1590 RepID=UPI003C17BD0B
MTEILITGAKGQLGSELRNLLDERDVKYDAFDSNQMDITDSSIVNKKFDLVQPKVVYHCAAYTAVDDAEDVGEKANYSVNVLGTENIARACAKQNTIMVYISTDYVFNGRKKSNEYMPSDPKDPLNNYGKAKARGEELVKELCPKYYIVRTSWAFGYWGKNFVYTMLRLAKSHTELTVVNDQFGRPTWVRTLAEFMTFLVNENKNWGIYQCCDDGVCTWYDFACEVLKDSKVKVCPVTSDHYPTKAIRPQYSVMHLSKETGFKFPNWKISLAKFMQYLRNKGELK